MSKTIIESWAQLTVGQYEELLLIQKEHPKDSTKYIVEYLYDIEDADRIPMQEYSCYLAGLRRFLEHPIDKARLSPDVSYTLNGREYSVDITPTSFTVAQYTDLTNYIIKKGTLTDLLTVVLTPAKHMYNDGYDMQQVRDDIATMPLEGGFAVISFFGRWSRSAIKTFLRFLTSQMKKTKQGKIDPKLMAKLEAEVQTLFNIMASRPMC